MSVPMVILQLTEFPLVLIRLDPLLSKAGKELTFVLAYLDRSAFGDGPQLQTVGPLQLFSSRNTTSTSSQLWLVFKYSQSNHLLNEQFMLQYHTKLGVNMSRQMAASLLESTLSWNFRKMTSHSLTQPCSGFPVPHTFCPSPFLLLHKPAL